MDLDLSQEIFNLLALRWQGALDKQQYQDAIKVSIAAYMLFHALEDSLHQDIPLTWLSVVEKQKALDRSHSSQSLSTQNLTCAFCLQSKPESELIAGASALICKSCVTNIADGLRSEHDSKPKS